MIKSLLAKLFKDTCPACGEALISSRDSVGWTKTCPQDHYKEESYGSLGVRIVTKGSPR